MRGKGHKARTELAEVYTKGESGFATSVFTFVSLGPVVFRLLSR
jgi:hypothetical protein